MSDRTPYLPPEIILTILSTDILEFADLLRLTSINKEWRSLMRNTNALRTKLFLAPTQALESD
jgi:hypothetical protein